MTQVSITALSSALIANSESKCRRLMAIRHYALAGGGGAGQQENSKQLGAPLACAKSTWWPSTTGKVYRWQMKVGPQNRQRPEAVETICTDLSRDIPVIVSVF
jgi:hypothetical protein